MSENELETTKSFSAYAYITAAQTVCAVIIIITILVVKLIFPSVFSKIKENYTERFLTETSISEVTGEIKDTESEAGVSEV